MTAPIATIIAGLIVLNIAQATCIWLLERKIALIEMRERIG